MVQGIVQVASNFDFCDEEAALDASGVILCLPAHFFNFLVNCEGSGRREGEVERSSGFPKSAASRTEYGSMGPTNGGCEPK